MRKQHTVLEVLFPQVRAEILRLLFTPPQKERYVRELMGMSGLALSTIQEELRKLTALQLVRSRSNRYHRFFRANREHALFSSLVHIVETSDKTPTLEHSAVRRQRRGRPRRRNKPHHLPPDRPVNWHLFSRKSKT